MDKLKNTNEAERLNDIWLRIIGIPIISILSGILLFSENRAKYNISLVKVLLVCVFISVVSWEINRQILLFFRRTYKEMHQTAFRVTGSFLGYFLSNVLLFCLLFAFYTATNFWEHSPTVEEFIISISVSVFFTIFLGGIYELKYYLRKWSDSIKESESLKSEKLQAQLNALRSQVNPHFLFNSLNTLESLAEEVRAPRVAKYVNELANVYRYSLKNQENDLIELEDELKFIEGYYYLLTTRYDNHLVLTIHVDEAQRKYLLPPLTLQILVENAVKHNVISAKCPLCITISSNGGDTITVLNALQPKKQAVLSHGMGLENIGSRYKLLGIEGPKVLKSAGEYNVVIKLINNASVRF